ncbi:Leucine-rich_repeat [Hexamita inflata]|uniref:Leucine-rich repeat n=1 Tax=Hexamita inflata TaxID=28002 RepID=A0AA86U923_9EUKA|nr:Leucine-rich repeat [Hexamita inflata]
MNANQDIYDLLFSENFLLSNLEIDISAAFELNKVVTFIHSNNESEPIRLLILNRLRLVALEYVDLDSNNIVELNVRGLKLKNFNAYHNKIRDTSPLEYLKYAVRMWDNQLNATKL